MYLDQIQRYKPVNQQERSDKNIIFTYAKEHQHNVLTRNNEVAHLTSSGFIMNKDLTKVLFIFHKIYQSWGWTGGHMDGDDDCLHVAIKEAMEETGLNSIKPLSENVMSLDVLPVWGHFKGEKYVSAHLHYNTAYVLIADEASPLKINEEETDGVMWVDVDEIETYSVEPDLNVVYRKLVEAARNYDPSKEKVLVHKEPTLERQDGFGKKVKDAAVPIAVHEAKSAYYKAKLVKEVASEGFKTLKKGSQGILRRFRK